MYLLQEPSKNQQDNKAFNDKIIKVMKCKICKHNLDKLFLSKVLNKYQVQYYQCPNCNFIQTEKPYWLKEAYQNAITDLDIGLVYRNIEFSKIIYKVITNSFDYHKVFLDYAGGYGLFTRIMRDKGLNYYSYDKYCENTLAKNYSLEDLKVNDKFEAITALEVFEHLEKPLEEIKKLLSLSNTIIFSTELIPNKKILYSNDWWYFSSETGQHIAFYSAKTLQYIAKLFNVNYYNQGGLHIFTTSKLLENPFSNQTKVNLPSLLESDFQKARKNAAALKKTPNSLKKLANKQEELFLNKLILLFKKNELLNKQLDSTVYELQQSVDKLHEIYSSQGWKFLRHLYLIRDYILPKNSKLKRILKANIFKIKNLKIKISNTWYRLNIQKNVNLNSKKIVFIGHSYHQKTKSNDFILDYLKKYFEVTEIVDESWLGEKPFPDLSFIDKSYLGVVFWQNLPSSEIIKKINNDNIIFFPMYDNVGGQNYDFWKDYINLKIINFSKTLHKKLKGWGFNSIYIQYFPKPLKFVKNKENKVFFWQRTNQIDINTVEKLLSNFHTKIHIHKAIDPKCTFIQPTSEQEKKFNITYSEWFKTREEMQKKIEECNIYIAPREYEGIGMSFLEAMAMGKVVIAPDNPTMNEYIINRKTGYLYNLNDTKTIKIFRNLSKIQLETYQYVKNGYKIWITKQSNIINFIKNK